MKGKLVPHPVPALLKAQAPYNPRTIEPGNLKRLQYSLERFGQVENVIVNTTTGHIVSGHQRVMAAHAAGLDTLDVLEVELTEGAEKALNVALNNPSLQGEWDMDKLKPVLDDVIGAFDIDLEDTGFDLEDYEEMFPPDPDGMEEAPIPEPPKDPTTEPGDVYVIDGRHRVMCGDSTKGEDVGRLMAGEKADMVFTDPPYGIEYIPENEGLASLGGLESDTKDFEVFRDFIINTVKQIYNHLRDGGCYYIFMGFEQMESVLYSIRMHDMKPYSLICWDRRTPVLRSYPQDYIPQTEWFVYGWKRGANRERPGNGENQTTLWSFTTEKAAEMVHTTQKPISLPTNAILNSSNAKDIITDYFLGSGTTLIAADQLGRTCYGMEIDPRYCDVIIERFRAYKPDAKIEVTHGTPDS